MGTAIGPYSMQLTAVNRHASRAGCVSVVPRSQLVEDLQGFAAADVRPTPAFYCSTNVPLCINVSVRALTTLLVD
jgi:hypothetical protein